MPIDPIVLQRRHAELGRIRLGRKVPVGDRGHSRPEKLDRFRFTSTSADLIADLALLYGGQAQPWDNNGKPEHEVITDAKSIDVVVVKGGLTQWMESWSGGGCVHRCDGVHREDGTPCDPDEVLIKPNGQPWTDRDGNPFFVHRDAKPTTRVAMMLPDLDALGVWRLETHGWNAAAEIPAIHELATFVGPLVPATLHLQERRAVKDGKTSRFVVPILDLRIGHARLQEVIAAQAGMTLELNAGSSDDAPIEQPRALERGTGPKGLRTDAEDEAYDREADKPLGPENPDNPYAEWHARVGRAQNRKVLADLWAELVKVNLAGPTSRPTGERDAFVEHFKARAAQIPEHDAPPAESAGSGSEAPLDEPVDAELVDDPTDGVIPVDHPDHPNHPDHQPTLDGGTAPEPVGDPDVLWQRIVTVAGTRGLSMPDLEDDFASKMGGVTTAEASAAELQHYLTEHLA